MISILTMPFMIRALVSGILVAVMSSLLGPFIVQRRMSFLGDGLSHTAFGGVALSLLLGMEPLYIAIPFTLLAAVGITWIKEHTNIEQDTSIGIFFAVSVALGVVFLALKKTYTADAYSYLFGSILSVSRFDIYVSFIMMIITIVMMIFFWRSWAYATFDKELAIVDKINVKRDDMLLSVLISMVIVLSVKLVGIVLIASFLVVPAASAKLISNTFRQMCIYSVIIGVIGAISGLIISVLVDMPSGAIIILVQASIFIIFTLFRAMKSR